MLRSPLLLIVLLLNAAPPAQDAADLLKRIGVKRGIVAVVQPDRDATAVQLAASTELTAWVHGRQSTMELP